MGNAIFKHEKINVGFLTSGEGSHAGWDKILSLAKEFLRLPLPMVLWAPGAQWSYEPLEPN